MVARQWALRDLSEEVVRPVLGNILNKKVDTKTEQKTACCAKPAEAEVKEVSSDASECQICTVCQWIYDPAVGEINQGVEPGTAWSEVPDYFLCPDCGLGKDVFDAIKKDIAA